MAVQAWFPLTVPHLGLVAQDVGQICELKQVLFVPLCICDVLSDVLVARNNVARGIAEKEAVGDLQRALLFLITRCFCWAGVVGQLVVVGYPNKRAPGGLQNRLGRREENSKRQTGPFPWFPPCSLFLGSAVFCEARTCCLVHVMWA